VVNIRTYVMALYPSVTSLMTYHIAFFAFLHKIYFIQYFANFTHEYVKTIVQLKAASTKQNGAL
jgi:hypothetical protein